MKFILSVLIMVSATVLSAQTLQVMSYNLRLDTPQNGPNHWPLRKAKVCNLIKKYNPDIIGVQEALIHQLEDLINCNPHYTFIGVGRDDGKTKGEYSAILLNKEKYDVLEQNTFWLSETPDVPGSKSWDAAITRVVTWGKLKDKKTSQEFFVINTHFDHIGKEARKNSAELLKVKATQLSGGLPLIITGDFNCTPDEAPYQVMTGNKDINLVDPSPLQKQGTFCTFEVNSIECKPIDYIFVTPHWETSNFTVISDNDGKYYPSDHLPIMVEVKH